MKYLLQVIKHQNTYYILSNRPHQHPRTQDNNTWSPKAVKKSKIMVPPGLEPGTFSHLKDKILYSAYVASPRPWISFLRKRPINTPTSLFLTPTSFLSFITHPNT
ncbi:Uncharacterized protein HZ326_16512 [Fusarium oxysporum f. sp. albedinis]|nr:Uncharacterized protein HZ326_16512 [Fusarium oxysporum f. sp. albedinis]